MRQMFKDTYYYLAPINFLLWFCMAWLLPPGFTIVQQIMVVIIVWFVQTVVQYAQVRMFDEDEERGQETSLLVSFALTCLFSVVVWFTHGTFFTLVLDCCGGAVAGLIYALIASAVKRRKKTNQQ